MVQIDSQINIVPNSDSDRLLDVGYIDILVVGHRRKIGQMWFEYFLNAQPLQRGS